MVRPEDTLRDAEANFKGATDEAGFRTAASRAYMATFQHLIRHVKTLGFVPKKTAEDHRGLIEFLKKSQDAALRKIGISRLPRLRAIRNIADYDTPGRFTREQAVDALDEATDILYQTLPWTDEATTKVAKAGD